MIYLTTAQKRTLVDITCLQEYGETFTFIPIKTFIVKRLIEKGVIVKTDGKYYLTEQGQEVYDSITLNTRLHWGSKSEQRRSGFALLERVAPCFAVRCNHITAQSHMVRQNILIYFKYCVFFIWLSYLAVIKLNHPLTIKSPRRTQEVHYGTASFISDLYRIKSFHSLLD